MKLLELMRQIQDACLNDRNLEKEVVLIYDNQSISTEKHKIVSVESRINNIQFHIEE